MKEQAADIHPKMYMYKRIVEAKLYIDAHFHEKIDLTNIASQACFSKYHFLRLFKQAYGKSPHQYLTQVRLDRAKELLNKEHSIAETCEATGFDSIPSFTLLFKKQVGKTPKAYCDEQQAQRLAEQQAPFNYVPNCFSSSYGWKK